MPIAKVEIKFETLNAAFDPDEETGSNDDAVADILIDLARTIRAGGHKTVGRSRTSCTSIHDEMGNTIGTLAIKLRGKNQ